MELGEINLDEVLYLFVLLLIGMGPKIAPVTFLDATSNMDGETRKKVANTMVRTAVGTVIILVVLGGILNRIMWNKLPSSPCPVNEASYSTNKFPDSLLRTNFTGRSVSSNIFHPLAEIPDVDAERL
jgi:hypothetical protein